MSNKIDVSVVVPLYNEEESLPELMAWIERVCGENSLVYEVIMVDDGSTDSSWSVVEAWWEFIKWHRVLSAKRKAVVRRTNVRGIYRGSIVLRYIFGKRKFKDMI